MVTSNLSTNLTLKECLFSQTATRLGINNEPNETQIESLKNIAVNVYEPLFKVFGKILVSSGFRNERLNRAIGGSKTSQHCKGEALDLDYKDNKELFNYIKDNLNFDQLIAEFKDKSGNLAWVHVSYSKTNRKQILVATHNSNGKTVYLPYTDELFKSIYP